MAVKNKALVAIGIMIAALVIATGAALFILSEPVQTEMLMWASESGDIAAVREHLADGGSPDVRDGWSGSPMFYAAGNGHTEIVELLLQRGVNIDTPYRMDKTALIIASQSGCVETVKFLIDAGADASRRDIEGKSALDHAIENKHSDVVALLRRGEL